jgi:hypothetical protein
LYSFIYLKTKIMNKNSIKSTLNNYLKQKNYPVSIAASTDGGRYHRKFEGNSQ